LSVREIYDLQISAVVLRLIKESIQPPEYLVNTKIIKLGFGDVNKILINGCRKNIVCAQVQ